MTHSEPNSPASIAMADRFRHLRTAHNENLFDAVVEYLAPRGVDHPCMPMWFEYALTCNQRGRYVAELLGQYATIAGRRYLDIGCAYGGFLVGFAEQGAEVSGIDVDATLLDLARRNFRDQALDAPLFLKDATSPDDMAEFRGRFDIVTCNDVIEHVLDPSSLVHNIAGVLHRDGIAYLEIPNRYFPGFVRQDGHYQLFGITLLERPEAQRYYEHYFTEIPYRTGHYLTLDQYDRMFRLAGLRLTVLEQTYEGGLDEGAILEAVAKLRANAGSGLEQVPHELREQVREALSHYLHEVETSLPETEAKRDSFVLRYGVSFWKLIVRKSAAVQ